MMKDQALESPGRKFEIDLRSSILDSRPSSLAPHPAPLTPQRSIRVTREGWFWLAFAGILWVSGLYKGINLLSFLGLLMMTACVIQWLGARRRLRGLGSRRWTDELVFAQAPFNLSVEISNPGRRAQFGLTVEDHGSDHSWFVPRLDAGAKKQFHADMVLNRRGLYTLQALRIRSSFPFGLVEACVSAGTDEELVVFPRLGRLHRSRLRRMLRYTSPSLGRARVHPRRHPAAQSDFHGLRSFRAGDSPHWIHWRTSARLGELMVREFEETPNDNLVLILDPWLPADSPEDSLTSNLLEDVISLAATICWEWHRPGGDQFVLAIANKNLQVIHGATGPDLAIRMLTCLAQVTGTDEPDIDQLMISLRPVLPPGPILLLSTRPGNLKTVLEQELHRTVTGIHIRNVTDLDFFAWEVEPEVPSQRSENQTSALRPVTSD
jgi:uncharacterized protein (DUF58 family)